MFCNQCGTQVPDNAAVCFHCGANLTPVQETGTQPIPPMQNVGAEQALQQPVQNMNAGQVSQQPMQNMGMGTGYGQPGMQQPNQQMYNGVPMPGYGQPAQPKANPLAFLTAVYPGETFPLKGMFSVKTLLSKITTIDLIGAVGALIMFISIFLPFLSGYGEYINMFKFTDELNINTTWMVIVLSIGALVLYGLRMEMLGFLASVLNLLVFVHIWTIGAAFKSFGGHFGVGFYFYLLSSIAVVIAPFVWGKIKKN